MTSTCDDDDDDDDNDDNNNNKQNARYCILQRGSCLSLFQ